MRHSFHDPVIAGLAKLAEDVDAEMVSTAAWAEFNVASTSTTTFGSTGNANWKSADNYDGGGASAWSANPVTAGNNSMEKIQAAWWSPGGFNSLSSFSYKVSNNTGTPSDSGWSIYGTTISAWTAPASSTTHDATLFPTAGVSFNATGGTAAAAGLAGGTSSLASTAGSSIFGQAMRTQLRSATTATPGDITAVTITAGWTES